MARIRGELGIDDSIRPGCADIMYVVTIDTDASDTGVQRLLDSAGFTDVREERISVSIVFPTADSAIGAAFIGGPVALAHSRFDDPTRESAYAEYLTSIEMHRQGEAYQVPGEFVAVVGRA